MTLHLTRSDESAPMRSIRRSPHFFESLIANTGDVLTLLDRDGLVLYTSPVTKQVVGLEPDQAIGTPASLFLHPDDRARFGETIALCLEQPEVMHFTSMRIRHQDGHWVQIDSRSKNLLNDPDVRGILVVWRDITEMQELSEKLSRAERAARFGFWSWGAGESIPVWSSGLYGMLGYASDHSMSNDPNWYVEIIHPDDRSLLQNALQDQFKTGEPFRLQLRLRAADGSYRHMLAHHYVERNHRGHVVEMAGFYQDVSEQTEVEKSLKRNEAQYKLIAEHALDIFARHEPQGPILYISPAVENILGMKPESVIGTNVVDFMHEEDRPTAEAEIAKLGHGTDRVTIEFRVRHRDGHWVWLESTLRALEDPITGEMSETIAISRNISDRKRHEAELLEARERAETANRTKSKFLANMSHELRTPLNAIIGFSDMLRREMFGELGHANYREYENNINDSGALLLDLINDILDMSKIEAGKMELHIEDIDLKELFNSCLRLVQDQAKNRRLTLRAEIDERAIAKGLRADLRSLKQITLNLLSNAIKFTEPGGLVALNALADGDHMVIEVRDTGVGIPESQIPRLMRPFEQARDSSVAQQGSGLGLALVKSLAELHGGSVTIESKVGVGTRVKVRMPFEAHVAVKATG